MADIPKTAEESDPRERVIWALRRAELAVQKVKDQRLRALGMNAAHYTLLISVDAEPGLAGATLARRLNVTPQAIASLVARLEDGGLVERRTHPRHPQVKELHLTAAGRDALREAEKVIDGIEQRVLDLIGADESEHLRAVLDKVSGAFQPA